MQMLSVMSDFCMLFILEIPLTMQQGIKGDKSCLRVVFSSYAQMMKCTVGMVVISEEMHIQWIVFRPLQFLYDLLSCSLKFN